MDNFSLYMSEFQAQWRKVYLVNQEPGNQNGKGYPWILPKTIWEEGLWSGIREGDNSLPQYLTDTGVQRHDGTHNLKSSWMQSANTYFPFREHRDMLAGFLHENVSPLIERVDEVELEWASESSHLSPTALLGEPQGQRGKNQTSPDIAFIVNGGKGIVLTENKLTEHSFYPCSGRKKEYCNPDPKRCMNLNKVYNNPDSQCYMLQWATGSRTNRKYWDYIRFSREGFSTLKYCPAATAGYQLFRQQALAEALAQEGPYEFVISSVAYDERNTALIRCLRGAGIKDFSKNWAGLFEGKAQFATFTHQKWVDWVRKQDSDNEYNYWLEYMKQRYDF